MNRIIGDILAHTLRTECVQTGVTALPATHSTGWRAMPFFMYSQVGAGAERIWLEDGRCVTARTGEMIVLPAGVRHKVDVASRREVRQWAHVNYIILGNLDLFTILEAPIVVDKATGETAGAVIREWVRHEPRDEDNPLLPAVRQQEFSLRLLALIAPVCRIKPGARELMEGLRRLDPVIQHMQRHLDRSMSRDDLARMAGLSPAQFHVVFNRVMRMSPVEYLRAVRLRQAQRLLIMTGAPVKEIAVQCGYDDPFVFCKFFKRAAGMSPTDYRQRTQWQPQTDESRASRTESPA